MARVLKELLSTFFSHFGCCFIWWFSWSWIRWGSRQSLNQLSVPTTSQSHVLGLVCQVAGRAKSVNVDDAEKKWISCPDPDVIQTFYWATVCCLSGCWMLASVLRRQTSMDIVSPHFDSIQRHWGFFLGRAFEFWKEIFLIHQHSRSHALTHRHNNANTYFLIRIEK